MLSACGFEGCTTPPIPPGTAEHKLGPGTVGGLCELHTLRTVVQSKHFKRVQGLTRANEYRNWLYSALATGCISYLNFTVYDIRLRDIATLTGLHQDTLRKIANGDRVTLKPSAANALLPYVLYTSTDMRSYGLRVGERVGTMDKLDTAPPLTGVVDRYGRLWQLRGKGWSPAHMPGHHTRYTDSYQLYLPARVVYLPPVLQSGTEN